MHRRHRLQGSHSLCKSLLQGNQPSRSSLMSVGQVGSFHSANVSSAGSSQVKFAPTLHAAIVVMEPMHNARVTNRLSVRVQCKNSTQRRPNSQNLFQREG